MLSARIGPVALEPRWFLVAPMAVLRPLLMHRRAQEVIDGVVANAKQIVERELAA